MVWDTWDTRVWGENKKYRWNTAWMEHVLEMSLKRYALSMEDKMAAGAAIMGDQIKYTHDV